MHWHTKEEPSSNLRIEAQICLKRIFYPSFFLFIESFSFFHSADLKRGKVGGLAEDHHHGHLDLPTPAIGSASRKGFPVMPPCPPSCQVDILLLVYLNGAARNPSAIDGGQKVSKGSLGRPFNRWVQAKVPLDLVSLRPSFRPLLDSSLLIYNKYNKYNKQVKQLLVF